jgi:hypothetical protein
MPVAGLRGTGDWGTDERPKTFREMILFRQPNGTAPIFALSSRANGRKKPTRDPEFSWWDEPNDIYRLQVNGALLATDTTITVDTADPDATSAGKSRVYGKATNLKAGDLLFVEPASDTATFNQEVVEVTNVLSDTQFTVIRGASGTTAASIANDLWLTKIGSSYAEGTGAPPAVSRNPVKYTNFTQIFKDTYELTGTADETETRTGSAWSNDKKRKQFDHASAIEWAILFGRKSETTGENGKPKRTMSGLRDFMGNITVFGGPVTVSSFYDAVGPIFDWETGGGDTRVGFFGHQALMELQKVFNADSKTQRDLGPKMTVYGMNLTEFIMPHGRLLIRTHPLLSRHGMYKKSGFIVDFDSFAWVPMRNRDTRNFDDVQAKDEDVRRGYIMTEGSVQVDRGGLTCAYLGNVSAT